ncbi:MAG: siderophore-interacting protein [Marmoricola sp.]
MHGRVVETRWLTPTLIRVVLGGGDLDGIAMVESTDAYVNLAFAPEGAPYDDVFDPAVVREEQPKEWWPARRRYTVRSWDAATGELTIDFVVHGDVGVAGAWARRARPGDVLVFEGPSGGYRPDPDADWLLMVGDESALPAIAASLEAVPPGTLAVVRLLCDGPDHEVELACDGNLALAWVHRLGDGRDGDLLAETVRDLPFPRGRVHAFVHGEATEIREIRRHLLAERGLSRQDMSCSPYWRRDMTDEDWRKVKRDFVAAMDADVAEADSVTEVA